MTLETFIEQANETGTRYPSMQLLDPVPDDQPTQTEVPYSECAIHCRYAGHQVQKVAIFFRDIPTGDNDSKRHPSWAFALLDNGVLAQGLVSEIVPWSIRRAHELN